MGVGRPAVFGAGGRGHGPGRPGHRQEHFFPLSGLSDLPGWRARGPGGPGPGPVPSGAPRHPGPGAVPSPPPRRRRPFSGRALFHRPDFAGGGHPGGDGGLPGPGGFGGPPGSRPGGGEHQRPGAGLRSPETQAVPGGAAPALPYFRYAKGAGTGLFIKSPGGRNPGSGHVVRGGSPAPGGSGWGGGRITTPSFYFFTENRKPKTENRF